VAVLVPFDPGVALPSGVPFLGVVPPADPAPTPTTRLYEADGTLGGFASNEPGLYFLVAPNWTLAGSDAGAPVVSLAPVPGDDGSAAAAFDLRLLLTPSYRARATLMRQIRERDAAALFVPLPITITHAALFLPPELGIVEAELVPAAASTPLVLYYRVRFTAEALGALRTLAQGGVALQGAIAYDYAAIDGPSSSTAPILVQLTSADLTPL
jgi:hypothetical protein